MENKLSVYIWCVYVYALSVYIFYLYSSTGIAYKAHCIHPQTHKQDFNIFFSSTRPIYVFFFIYKFKKTSNKTNSTKSKKKKNLVFLLLLRKTENNNYLLAPCGRAARGFSKNLVNAFDARAFTIAQYFLNAQPLTFSHVQNIEDETPI